MTTNEYMREYMRNRYKDRMDYLRDRLGGKCVGCGAVDNLHIHHIDPQTKEFTLSTAAYKMTLDKLEIELRKCELLCVSCHKKKHEAKHGTLSVRNCKCDLCKEAKRKYIKEYMQIRRLKQRLISSNG